MEEAKICHILFALNMCDGDIDRPDDSGAMGRQFTNQKPNESEEKPSCAKLPLE